MKTLRKGLVHLAVILAALSLAACGAVSTGQTTGGTPPTTAAATATETVAKAKPTGVPNVTQAYCQSLMSLAEANQIMQPSNPYVEITVTHVDTGAVCTYSPAQPSYTVSFAIALSAYSGPVPVPQQQINSYLAQLESDTSAHVTADTNVTGVGDQAAYVVATGTNGQISIYVGDLFVLDGNVVIVCSSLFPAAPGAAQEAQLQQCAQMVISQL